LYYIFFILFFQIHLKYAITTLKDVILFVGGMILLGVVYQLINDFLLIYLDEGIFKFIVQCICLAPIYYPLTNHFVKMCKTRQAMDEGTTG